MKAASFAILARALPGAFVYANQESVSVGIVATMSEVLKQDIPVYQMLENFKNRPEIKPLIAGGKTVEYSGHVVPEGGIKMMPEIIGDGVVVAGDAAMMCMNLGYTVRGMDLAVESGAIAAKAVIQAIPPRLAWLNTKPCSTAPSSCAT